MGNLNCCSQYSDNLPKKKIISTNMKNFQEKNAMVRPDNSSTSDSQTQKFELQSQSKFQKPINFINFISQKSFDISSIQKLSQCSECFSEHQTFIKYVQKFQKELSQNKDQKDLKTVEMMTDMDKHSKINMKLFIEHSSKCTTCFELYDNLKNMEAQQNFHNPIESGENRISLRDSLLEFEQCQKAKRGVECKCQMLNSQQEAAKALKKYPNTNKYQSKNLKFRKTSMFELEIKQECESQESF